MKIIKSSSVLCILASVSTYAISQDYDYGYENDDSYGGQQEQRYESSTGTQYEYDLSDPSDRIMYEVDPEAQLRDSIDVNPMRDIDRGLGEYGGGIYDD